VLPDRAVVILDIYVDVVPVCVAPPALEHPSVVEPLGLDVLGIVDRPAGLARDEEQVVGVRGARHGCEEVVAQHVLLSPMPVVGDVARRELRVGEVPPIVADREPVHPPAVERGLPGIEAVGHVTWQPLRARNERRLSAPSHAHAGATCALEPPEEVVDAAVLEHQVDDMFDSHLVSIRSGTRPNVGRGVGVVETRSPKHEDRNRPAAAAADRLMKLRRVNRPG